MLNVECDRMLGLMVDSNLSWKDHIDWLVSKLSKIVALFRRIKIYSYLLKQGFYSIQHF